MMGEKKSCLTGLFPSARNFAYVKSMYIRQTVPIFRLVAAMTSYYFYEYFSLDPSPVPLRES